MPSPLEKLRAALAGRYEIDKEIGQGGMATVYLADDLRHERKVAVKVLRPDLAAALGPERFLREIKIAANLTHPHILPLYDSGEADGFLYYVMPYIEGDTLRERIEKEGELPVSEAVRIIREVVDALASAHSQGVVHRDIKPDNIMLSGRHAMVMDFGVAKAVSEATGRNTLTTVGVALGTPTYMAPEQATADPHVDHRADIYAVGVMAYELLAGRTPFQGASPQAVLAAHVTEEAEPVSKHRDRRPGSTGDEMLGQEAGRPVAERRRDAAAPRGYGHHQWWPDTHLHAADRCVGGSVFSAAIRDPDRNACRDSNRCALGRMAALDTGHGKRGGHETRSIPVPGDRCGGRRGLPEGRTGAPVEYGARRSRRCALHRPANRTVSGR
jgi:serine/threonine protein kinase